MTTKYIQPGDIMQITLTGTVAVDDVDIIGTGLIGVALVDGVSGDEINYGIRGVYELPKVTGAVILQGEQVLWDSSAGNIDDDAATPATGDFLCGIAQVDAGSGVLVCNVLINKGSPAVTA